jgi:hypothetical protein
MISPIQGYGFSYVSPIYNYNNSALSPVNPVAKSASVGSSDNIRTFYPNKVNKSECQTCKSRKYVDQSNEGNVSFKAPGHISPEASYAKVSAHEMEHVGNAISEGSKEGSNLVSSSVRLKMSVCPECGTPYVSGGVTSTTMEYNTSNPYERERKSIEEGLLKGQFIDYVA